MLVLLFLSLLLAHHVSADANAAVLPQAQLVAAQPGQVQSSLPPLIAALTALRDPPLTLSIATSSDGSPLAARSSRPAAASATAAPRQAAAAAAASAAPLDALRPAAAAALARQHESPSAPMTDDDITAINVLLGREGPPTRPYAYDTGLPLTTTTLVPHLLTFGNYSARSNSTSYSTSSNGSRGSSMQSVERLGRMSSLGQALSWVARTFAVSGDTLMKLRITQQLQLILQDAISDSLASAASLPPNQVVTFASSNLTLPLEFTGVDWDNAGASGAAAAAAAGTGLQAGLPRHKGLLAVQKALQQLTGNFDPGHTLVSFDQFPPGPTRAATAAAKGAKQRTGGASTAGAAAGGQEAPTAANSARKLLLLQQQQQGVSSMVFRSSRGGGSSSSSRALLADAAGPGAKTVYVRLYGMDPMNLTSLVERLGNCSAQQALLEAGQQAGATSAQQGSAAAAATAHPGRMPQTPAGQPLSQPCAEVFRQQFSQQGVRVAPGPGFSVSPKQKPQAAIELSVAIGLTIQQQQQASDSDTKAAAWLNSTAMQDILGTFNLTVASSDADYVSYLRDPQSGQYPALPGFNISGMLPALFQQVLQASRDAAQQQEPQQGGSVLAAPTALSRGILAGIIVAVVASVLALLGVVVLLLRRRGDSSTGSSSGQHDSEAGVGAGPNRRRKRRPRLYHNKYLPDGGPVLGRDSEPQSDGAASSAHPAAAAAEGPRHTLERGDSVMSQVHIERDDAEDEGDQGSQASSSSSAATAGAAVTALPAGAGGSKQQRQWQEQLVSLQRQEGEAGSGCSSVGSRRHLLGAVHASSSNAAVSMPAESSGWGSSTQGSVTGRSVSAATDLTAHSSVLSPWTSNGDLHSPAAVLVMAGEPRACNAGKHRLAVASPAAPLAAKGAGHREQLEQLTGEGPSCSGRQPHDTQQPQQQQQQLGPGSVAAGAGAAAGTLSMASAFAAMDAQLAAAVRAGSRHSGGGGSGKNISGGGSSTDSANAIQPLGMSCWHKDGHVSGFCVPEVAAGSSAGVQQPRPSTGGLVSPFAAAIQLAQSVASDEV